MNQEYGIAIHTGEYNPNAYYGRATIAETYAQIISDLEKGNSEFNETTVNKGYLSATASRLMLAKAYLTRGEAGDYQKAIQYADEALMANATISSTELESYFKGTTSGELNNQPETVFEINMSVIANPGVNRSISAFYDPYGAKIYLMFRADYINSIAEGDVRKGLFIQDNASENDDPKAYYVQKCT